MCVGRVVCVSGEGCECVWGGLCVCVGRVVCVGGGLCVRCVRRVVSERED